MKCSIIKDFAELCQLRPQWQELCQELTATVTPFSTPEWYETWWRHYSADGRLNLITMWDGSKLAGIAPLMIRRASMHGLPARALCFIENNQTPLNDFLVLPPHRELFIKEMLRLIMEPSRPREWEIVFFNKLPVTSPNYQALLKVLSETGRTWRQEQVLDSRYLVPSGTWQEFLAGRTVRTRKTLRNIQNKMEKEAEVSVQEITRWDEYQSVQEELYEVARQSWTEEHGDSIGSPANQGFFTELAQKAAAKGWLSVWALRINGKMAAIEYHLRAFGKEHAMRGHYLPEFALLSPGTFLELLILKQRFEEPERATKYDLGNFYEYKKKWTELSEPHMSVSVYGNGFYSRFLAFHEGYTVPLCKRLLPQRFWNSRLLRKIGINTYRFDIRQS